MPAPQGKAAYVTAHSVHPPDTSATAFPVLLVLTVAYLVCNNSTSSRNYQDQSYLSNPFVATISDPFPVVSQALIIHTSRVRGPVNCTCPSGLWAANGLLTEAIELVVRSCQLQLLTTVFDLRDLGLHLCKEPPAMSCLRHFHAIHKARLLGNGMFGYRRS